MAQSHGYLSSIGIDPVTAVASSLTPPEEKDAQGTNGSSAPSRAKKTGATSLVALENITASSSIPMYFMYLGIA